MIIVKKKSTQGLRGMNASEYRMYCSSSILLALEFMHSEGLCLFLTSPNRLCALDPSTQQMAGNMSCHRSQAYSPFAIVR